MSKKLLVILLFGSSSAFAVLPPLAQSSKEIQAILGSNQTYSLLNGAYPINDIIRTPKGYLIITADQRMQVDIEYQQSEKIGPIPFTLNFHPPVSLE